MSRRFLIAVVLLVSGSPASAQPSLAVDFSRALDSVAFTGAESEGRAVMASAVDAEYQALDERLRFWYALDMSTYNLPGEWGSFLHAGGATWNRPLGSGSRRTLYVGGAMTTRQNGLSWETADFYGMSAFVNAEIEPTDALALRTGYQVDRRSFPEFEALDQTQHQIFGSALVSFPSRTTLLGEVYVGRKTYDGTAAMAMPVHAAGTPISTSGGWSASGGATAGAGAGTGRGRPGFTGPPTLGTVTIEGEPGTTAAAVTLYGRIAQGLTDRTGLAADLAVRNTFGELPPAVVTTPVNFFDDGVYDDPFASDATTASGTLTHVWPSLTKLRGSASWSERRYTSTPAYGTDGLPLADGTLRHDDVWRASIQLELPILASRTGPWTVAVIGAYDYTHHRSTDVFYRYTSHAVGLGVSVLY
jgi:hypothetical protein